MIIAVSGHQGSGKTTLCERLAPVLAYSYTYVGGIFRKMAEEQGKHIAVFYKELEDEPEREIRVDAEIRGSVMVRDNQIVEGRMAPFWPTKFEKVSFLFTVDPEVGLSRQAKREEHNRMDIEEVLRLSRERLASERARYKNLYGIEDFLSPSRFDEVIDTTHLDRDQVFHETLSRLEMHGLYPPGTSRR